MQAKGVRALYQGIAVCALLVYGLPFVQTAAAQTSPETQTDKAVQTKRTKKSATDAATGQSTTAVTPAKKAMSSAPAGGVSSAEIQSAKTGGKVWVNTESGIYHKGGKWFGTTKQGKFMTEQEATRAGYRAAKNEK
jgi:hypothetical protein